MDNVSLGIFIRNIQILGYNNICPLIKDCLKRKQHTYNFCKCFFLNLKKQILQTKYLQDIWTAHKQLRHVFVICVVPMRITFVLLQRIIRATLIGKPLIELSCRCRYVITIVLPLRFYQYDNCKSHRGFIHFTSCQHNNGNIVGGSQRTIFPGGHPYKC